MIRYANISKVRMAIAITGPIVLIRWVRSHTNLLIKNQDISSFTTCLRPFCDPLSLEMSLKTTLTLYP